MKIRPEVNELEALNVILIGNRFNIMEVHELIQSFYDSRI
jgi:hypothetical protein